MLLNCRVVGQNESESVGRAIHTGQNTLGVVEGTRRRTHAAQLSTSELRLVHLQNFENAALNVSVSPDLGTDEQSWSSLPKLRRRFCPYLIYFNPDKCKGAD